MPVPSLPNFTVIARALIALSSLILLIIEVFAQFADSKINTGEGPFRHRIFVISVVFLSIGIYSSCVENMIGLKFLAEFSLIAFAESVAQFVIHKWEFTETNYTRTLFNFSIKRANSAHAITVLRGYRTLVFTSLVVYPVIILLYCILRCKLGKNSDLGSMNRGSNNHHAFEQCDPSAAPLQKLKNTV
jgi:hypothetical protein